MPGNHFLPFRFRIRTPILGREISLPVAMVIRTLPILSAKYPYKLAIS
jgi:hypothetical protein